MSQLSPEKVKEMYGSRILEYLIRRDIECSIIYKTSQSEEEKKKAMEEIENIVILKGMLGYNVWI